MLPKRRDEGGRKWERREKFMCDKFAPQQLNETALNRHKNVRHFKFSLHNFTHFNSPPHQPSAVVRLTRKFRFSDKKNDACCRLAALKTFQRYNIYIFPENFECHVVLTWDVMFGVLCRYTHNSEKNWMTWKSSRRNLCHRDSTRLTHSRPGPGSLARADCFALGKLMTNCVWKLKREKFPTLCERNSPCPFFPFDLFLFFLG